MKNLSTLQKIQFGVWLPVSELLDCNFFKENGELTSLCPHVKNISKTRTSKAKDKHESYLLPTGLCHSGHCLCLYGFYQEHVSQTASLCFWWLPLTTKFTRFAWMWLFPVRTFESTCLHSQTLDSNKPQTSNQRRGTVDSTKHMLTRVAGDFLTRLDICIRVHGHHI